MKKKCTQLSFPYAIHRKNVKKYMDLIDDEWGYTNFNQDVLAISCYAARNNISYLDTTFSEKVEQCDIDLADTIKKYYRDKLTLIMLKGKNFSNFRKGLYTFVSDAYEHRDTYSCPTSLLGLICKLPYFYKYDLEIEKLFGSNYRKLNLDPCSDTSFYSSKTINLLFKTKIDNTSSKNKEYWFETEHNDLLLVTISYTNPLEKLFHRTLIEHNNRIELDMFFEKKIRDDLEFLLATHWTF